MRYPRRYSFDPAAKLQIDTGTVLVGSDPHYYPGIISAGHRAFVEMARRLEPVAIILNGDVFDGSRISRFPPISWKYQPSVAEELKACQERLAEIRRAAPRAALFWPLGNHCQRFETRLASVAPEYAHVPGTALKHHFPDWRPCWAVHIGSKVVVKHRWHGGAHAVWQNVVRSGRSILTGHLHSLKIMPYTDYNGTRWGVDCGMLADPDGPQFADYTESNAKDWRQGFIVLTFHKGRLLWPEPVWVRGQIMEFRGQVERV